MANNKKNNKKDSPEVSQAKDKKTNINPKKAKRRKIIKRVGLSILFLILTVMVVGLGYVVAVLKSTPALDKVALQKLNEPTKLYFNDETFMTNVQTEEQRFVVKSEQIPQHLKDAYVSIEDERFYKHDGVDIIRIGGSVINNIKTKLTGSGGIHGGSTITQQLVKNTILTDELSIERKIKEAYLAIQIENNFSKDEIITLYLNTIPLGGTAYGVEAASYLYFGKPVQELNLLQCAYIAGITQAPTTYSFYNSKNQEDPSRYINRTITVLGKMLELGYITQEEHDKAVADAKENKFEISQKQRSHAMEYQWVAYPALNQVKADLKKKYGYTDEEITKMIVNGGLNIYTTVDKELQDYTQAVLDDYKNLGLGNKESFNDDGMPLLQASATVIDPFTGEIKALVGGRGPHKPKSLNRAYDGLRPVGSTTKPLTGYGPAIDQKIMTAGSAIDDSPLPSSIGDKYQKGWSPNNWDKRYLGYITPRDAIRDSKNVATVLTVDEIGLNTAVNYGEKLGLKYNNNSKKSMSALALGQFDNDPADKDGGNTTILASAFSTFVNNGDRVEPLMYSKVVDASGNVILEAEKNVTNVYSPQAAYIMYDLLKGPIGGLGSKAKFGSMPIAGKTGTTSDGKDLLFAGTTPYYSGAVWFGYDKPEKLIGGSNDAAGVWGKIMKKAHEGLEVKDIAKPDGIVSAPVCKDSGKVPTDLCNSDPRGGRVYTEMFIKGTEPTALCETHVKAKVNKLNGKLANDNTPAFLVEERVFINKPHASSSAADYAYVLPTSGDDTVVTPEPPKPEEDGNNEDNEDGDTPKPTDEIDLSTLGLKGSDANKAMKTLKDNGVTNVTIKGGEATDKFTVVSYSPNKKIKKTDPVELTVKAKESNVKPTARYFNPFVSIFSYFY
ncbi:MAG: transglycosylase domain-containing protein [Clostridium sp.]